MHCILHSPSPIHSLHSQFPFFSRLPFPPIRNQSLTSKPKPHKKPPPNPFSLASITSSITFPSRPTPTPQPFLPDDDVLASPVKCLLKQALFCFAVGVSALTLFRAPPATAITAAPPAENDVVSAKKRASKGKKNAAVESHEYADCTEKLLKTVSVLLRSVEDVRSGNGGMNEVDSALKAVKSKKEEMKNEIMGRLYPQLRVIRRGKNPLVRRGGEIIDEILKLKGEYEKLKRKKKGVVGEKEKLRMEWIEKRVGELEDEYNGIWEKVGEIEDRISEKETVALSYGVREINFIERECEQMVERFKLEMKQKGIKRSYTLH